jgi:hypothetical protein
MKSSGKMFVELQAWLDRWDENGAEPDEPEPETPVGQRRRSPDGAEVIKTDDLATDPWRRYRGPCPAWFTDDEVAGWEVITDAPDCDREHLPEGYVPITFNG